MRYAELLRGLQDRGRFFYERFAGAAAAEEWKRVREKAAQEHDSADARDGVSDPEAVKTVEPLAPEDQSSEAPPES